jgi:bifunctional ADP-heptose synthase (sugar kinase/adenylyltransferase)
MLIFSDFNYGCLPQPLVDEIISLCNKHGVAMVADSQSSSQIGDLSRFHGMLLVTPTEHEARLAMRDHTSGLIVLAESLRQKTKAAHILITLGVEGLLIHSPQHEKNGLASDQLPAFNTVPKDVSGGGDCLLICTALALATGANIWESAYLGSIAAACHVGRMGNIPLTMEEVLREVHA